MLMQLKNKKSTSEARESLYSVQPILSTDDSGEKHKGSLFCHLLFPIFWAKLHGNYEQLANAV